MTTRTAADARADLREAFLQAAATRRDIALPSDARRGGNCGVTAVAIAARVPFAEAFAVIKLIRKAGPRWIGRTRAQDRKEALRIFKVPFEVEPLPCGMTLATFVAKHTVPGRRYMVQTGRHVQIVLNRQVTDQRGCVPISVFWGRSKRVMSVWWLR